MLMRMPFLVDLKGHEKAGNHQWLVFRREMPSVSATNASPGTTMRSAQPRLALFRETNVSPYQYRNCIAIHSGASWEEAEKMWDDVLFASATLILLWLRTVRSHSFVRQDSHHQRLC